VTPEIITAAITGGIGAFTGLSRALNGFSKKLDRRFERIEDDIDMLHDRLAREYVLKEDFLREMEAVHNKLDRILDHLLKS
jgi:hypothetical protein|tara:strand:- start:7371 stop:7613 length:243 start_codon:yes stop_codon:yes gene_type:complete